MMFRRRLSVGNSYFRPRAGYEKLTECEKEPRFNASFLKANKMRVREENKFTQETRSKYSAQVKRSLILRHILVPRATCPS